MYQCLKSFVKKYGAGVSSWNEMKGDERIKDLSNLQSNESKCVFTRHYHSQLVQDGNKASTLEPLPISCNTSNLHRTILILFCILFMQWSMFPLVHFFIALQSISKRAHIFEQYFKALKVT